MSCCVLTSHCMGRTQGGDAGEGDTGGAAPSFVAAVNGEAVQKVPRGGSLLDKVTHAAWDERASQGLFRYDVTNLPSTVLPGTYGFLAQFNEGRHSKKRPTEYTVAQVRLRTRRSIKQDTRLCPKCLTGSCTDLPLK
jgi:hypothetical protein